MTPEAAGSPVDFEEFYAGTVNNVLAIARRAADSDPLAWDATQEAYARMLERWTERRSLCLADNRRYTIKIAFHLIMDDYRHRKRVAELDDEQDWAMEDSSFVAVVDDTGLLRAVRRFIARQPPRRRAVGVLFLLEEWETCEIASALGMAESTVRTHKERLLDLLKPVVKRFIETEQGGERS
jgi:RNA polymerase sigma factor (sigma-70 family)